MESDALRIPPHSVEAERGVLGSLLLDPMNSIGKAQGAGVSAESFFDLRHQTLYKNLLEMACANVPMDALTIGEWLKDRGDLERVGGFEYLVELQGATLVPAHVEHYSGIVAEKKLYRSIIDVSAKMMDAAYTGEDGAKKLLHEFPARIARLVASSDSMTNAVIIDAWLDRIEKIKNGELKPGLPLPWDALDRMMCGLKPGLIMLGARPSVGKTSLAVGISDHLASQGIPGAWVPRDMGWEQTLVRSIIRESRVSLPRLDRGYARWNQVQTVKECGELVKKWPLYPINECFLDNIMTQARMLKLKYDIQYLILDFLTLFYVEHWRGERRTEIGRITGSLKGLGLDLGIPVILLSQLSRASVKEGRRARMDDFRESGDIEQDATQAILLSKAAPDDYDAYDKDTNPQPLPDDADRRFLRGVVVDLAKNQQGETGMVEMWLRPNYFRFERAEPGWVDLQARLSEFRRQTEQDEVCDPDELAVCDGDDDVEIEG